LFPPLMWTNSFFFGHGSLLKHAAGFNREKRA